MAIKGARGASVPSSMKPNDAVKGGVFNPPDRRIARMRRHDGPEKQDESNLDGMTVQGHTRVSGGSAGGASVQISK